MAQSRLLALKSVVLVPNETRLASKRHLRPGYFVGKGFKDRSKEKWASQLSEEEKKHYLVTSVTTPKALFDDLRDKDKPLYDFVAVIKNMLCKEGTKIDCLITLHMFNREHELFPHIHVLMSEPDFHSTPTGRQLYQKGVKAGFVMKINRMPLGKTQDKILGGFRYLQDKSHYLIGMNAHYIRQAYEIALQRSYIDPIDLDPRKVDDDYDVTGPDMVDNLLGDHGDLSEYEQMLLQSNPDLKAYFTLDTESVSNEDKEVVDFFDTGIFDQIPRDAEHAGVGISGARNYTLDISPKVSGELVFDEQITEPKPKKQKLLTDREEKLESFVAFAQSKGWTSYIHINKADVPVAYTDIYRKLRINSWFRKQFNDCLQQSMQQDVPTLWESMLAYDKNEDSKQYFTIKETAEMWLEFAEQFTDAADLLYTLYCLFKGDVGDTKKSGLRLWGAPNTGKTTWLDKCIASNLGKVGKLVADSTFTFSSLANANIAVINEIRFAEDQVELLKDLMDKNNQKTVAVKGKASTSFMHDIVFFFTHNKDFLDTLSGDSRKALEGRMYTYYCSMASPAIADHKQRSKGIILPNPLFFQQMLVKIDENYEDDYETMISQITDMLFELLQ